MPFPDCLLKLKGLNRAARFRFIASLGEHSNARMAVELEGGLSMRKFRTAAAALAATGITALGALAATGGVANAATDLSITGCSTNGGLYTVGFNLNESGPPVSSYVS